MRKSSELDELLDACLQEWSEWMRERDQWIDDIDQWDQYLRQLILLTHELDAALPYELQGLTDHLDAIKEHQKTLEAHGIFLNQVKDRAGHGGVARGALSDVRHEQSKLRHQHARVHDAHVGLRDQHHQAIERVDGLLKRFRKQIGR